MKLKYKTIQDLENAGIIVGAKGNVEGTKGTATIDKIFMYEGLGSMRCRDFATKHNLKTFPVVHYDYIYEAPAEEFTLIEQEFKQGELIQVSDNPEFNHKKPILRKFIAMYKDKYICEDNTEMFPCSWAFARKIKEEPKYVPWESLNEVPLDAWFSADIECGILVKVTGININEDKVMLGGLWFDMKELHNRFVYSNKPNAMELNICGKPNNK